MEKGKVLPNVLCRENRQHSYALYLPADYSPEKEWPILYAMDPGARGQIPVELFRAAAEKYHYIIAGSNNARNGPWQHVIQSIIILWNDTNQQFSIDKRRIYVAGFSGGARAASLFARVIMQPVAGIIGCGAGLAKTLVKPEQIPPAYYFGIVGMADFNYREMMLLRNQFTKLGSPHRFLVHKGGHDWPEEETCLRAIQWMEVIGIRSNIRTMDKDLIRTVFEKERGIARSLESKGDLYQALSCYTVLAETFDTWIDVSSLRDKILSIQKSPAYLSEERDVKRIEEREIQHLQKFGQAFSRIEKITPPVEKIENFVANLGLSELRVKSEDKKAGRENFMAIRLLDGLEIDAGSKGWESYRKEDIPKAIFYFSIASRGGRKDSPRKKQIFYTLACAYARIQNKNNALENLRLAVAYGYDEIENMEQDKDLAFIRSTEEFAKILETIKQRIRVK